ncbi:MAG: hypothetical protein H8E44_46170, partial [Planctomycetes bacterium]|nr:hypothetical protein [Planctomycetota bacterium]
VEGKAARATGHPAPYFTDKEPYDVGTGTANEPDAQYDTPSLVEAYRTAPYYHDGRAVTIKEALTEHDFEHLYGNLWDLTPQEIDDLIAYVLSL